MNSNSDTRHKARIWDIPVRVFHWLLVLLIISQIVTVSIGGNAMEYHVLGGYAILTLVTFRLAWGVFGTRAARFASFVRGPVSVWRYARSLFGKVTEKHAGHNPLGGWSVVAMLMSLLVQTISGLFADDEIMTTGPLWKYVSEDTASLCNVIHETNAAVLLSLICIHLAAILFYLVGKKQNLIKPMITGKMELEGNQPESLGFGEGVVKALVILAVCAGVTWFVVTF